MAIQAQMYSENLGFAFGSAQDLAIYNGCALNQFRFDLQQQPEKKQQQQLQQQLHNMQYQPLQNLDQNNQNIYFENIDLVQNNNTNGYRHHQSLPSSQYFKALIEKQKLEMDRFISLQNERLRWALREQKKEQLALILGKYERKTRFLLKQKGEEIAKAGNRTMELEDLLKRMEIEKQAWQKLAKENEAMVLSLNSTIEQLRENACFCSSSNGVEDAGSCCDGIDMAEEQEVNAKQMMITRKKMVCKGCNSRCSCIIILPCRHLCLCKVCEAFLASCPLCGIEKEAIIEALL